MYSAIKDKETGLWRIQDVLYGGYYSDISFKKKKDAEAYAIEATDREDSEVDRLNAEIEKED